MEELKRNWKIGKLSYAVGALLYSPAIHETVADSIIERRFAEPYSLTLCLEDSIGDNAVEAAEKQLMITLKKVYEAWKKGQIAPEHLPLIFVRVRSPRQLEKLAGPLMRYSAILAGFVFPKFSIDQADRYIGLMHGINRQTRETMYMLPILESGDIIDLRTRVDNLYKIKEKLDQVSYMVLNVRVGGNDFCSRFGVRRHCKETIYDIRTVSNVLTDILTVFSGDYVVSGPVWEYFAGGDDQWKEGLIRETSLDLLNGFVGKTVIHPLQIPVVNGCLMPSASDYRDACNVMAWDGADSGVEKSCDGGRMNEKKTHEVWAEKILHLAEVYGVNDDANI